MAQLALRLQVFIASPGDVVPERDVVEEEVRVLSVEAARDGILLESYRWDTDLPYGFGRPQGRIIPALEESELFVGLLWSRLGTPSSVTSSETGFQEELRIATDRATQGQLDDVLLYFKHLPAPAADAAQWEKVQEFKRNLEESKTHFPGKFTTLDEFRPIFRKRLRDWYKRWRALPAICQKGLLSAPPPPSSLVLGENLLEFIRRFYDFEGNPALTSHLGRLAVARYQNGRSHADFRVTRKSLDKSAPNWADAALQVPGPPPANFRPLRAVDPDEVTLTDELWFFFFCACGLLEAILANHTAAVANRAYVNPVHQFLSELGKARKVPLERQLRNWLTGADATARQRPVIRDFAAFVLGMLQARDAADDLAKAAQNDPADAVRYYSIISLLRMRCRKHLPTLLAIYETAPSELQRMIAAGICHMIGLCPFGL